MPVSKYYKGSGEKVMRSMKERYGDEKGERVFYATAKKRGLDTGPSKKTRRKHGVD